MSLAVVPEQGAVVTESTSALIGGSESREGSDEPANATSWPEDDQADKRHQCGQSNRDQIATTTLDSTDGVV